MREKAYPNSSIDRQRDGAKISGSERKPGSRAQMFGVLDGSHEDGP